MKQKWALKAGDYTMAGADEQRFRSFAERYVIERASQWKLGEEDEGGWEAIQRAKMAYVQIELVAKRMVNDLNENTSQSAPPNPVGQGFAGVGVTGAYGRGTIQGPTTPGPAHAFPPIIAPPKPKPPFGTKEEVAKAARLMLQNGVPYSKVYDFLRLELGKVV